MNRSFKIPMTVLCVTVAVLAAAEALAGTGLEFVALMAGALLCAGVTYNTLGGLGTLSGIAFAAFAASNIGIAQFAKVLLWEAADRPLESPGLTIRVYFVFYLCAMIGTFVYSSLRIRLPRPLEPETAGQAGVQYAVSLTVGLLASLVYEISEASPNLAERATTLHSLGLAFSMLLLFSLVLGVQSRIRTSGGRHSFGFKAWVPWAATVFFGYTETSRAHMLLPTVLYAFTCYASGYRFRRKHYVAAAVGVAAFYLVISPFEIYARGPMRELGFTGRMREGISLVTALPDWTTVTAASLGGAQSGSREEYYMRPGTFVLSRLSAIRADSNMINACAGGFHYGFTALKIDLQRALPRFISRNKPEYDGAAYTGRVTGVNGDEVEDEEIVITAIGDSFGAFGWLGVVVVALIGIPSLLIVYESVFDIRKPWGIVAAGGLCFQFAQASMSGMVTLMIRVPVAILLLSYLVGAVVRMIPVRGDASPLLDQELLDRELLDQEATV